MFNYLKKKRKEIKIIHFILLFNIEIILYKHYNESKI